MNFRKQETKTKNFRNMTDCYKATTIKKLTGMFHNIDPAVTFQIVV